MKFLSPHRGHQSIKQTLLQSPGILFVTFVVVSTLIYLLSNTSYNSGAPATAGANSSAKNAKEDPKDFPVETTRRKMHSEDDDVDMSGLNKGTDVPFMPKMANETLKAELGRASWRLFHTILARYPDEPTETERTHLNTFINSFAQVYPCGDCARHFIQLLQKYPPQTNSRKNAAVWGCHIHNKVNERLGHPIYDCTNILEDYDCGCGTDEETKDDTLKGKTSKQVQDKAVEKDETKQHLKSIKVESKEENVHG